MNIALLHTLYFLVSLLTSTIISTQKKALTNCEKALENKQCKKGTLLKIGLGVLAILGVVF